MASAGIGSLAVPAVKRLAEMAVQLAIDEAIRQLLEGDEAVGALA